MPSSILLPRMSSGTGGKGLALRIALKADWSKYWFPELFSMLIAVTAPDLDTVTSITVSRFSDGRIPRGKAHSALIRAHKA